MVDLKPFVTKEIDREIEERSCKSRREELNEKGKRKIESGRELERERQTETE